jgi:UDP:flavonoid glycosyltransferase YjiC (YdhE family)
VSRFLIVVPPLVGHINPVVGVAAELTARGHRVAWAGEPELVARLAGSTAEVFACAVPRDACGAPISRPPGLRGPAALQFLWEQFLIPLGAAMAPDVLAAAERFRPDVMVVDQQAVAGALVAERLGVPWVTSATTSAEFVAAGESMPLVEAWVSDLLEQLRTRIGSPPGSPDPRFSPHLTIAFTTPELAGWLESPGGPIRFVGPSITARPGYGRFPVEWLDPRRRLVLVSLGTVNTDAGSMFLTAAHAALADRVDRLQAVIVDPGNLLADAPVTDGVLVLPAVPQVELLPHCSAVVCHAGHNTVCEALWHGVPLVVAPILDDQPTVAGQVVTAGAGVRVRFGRITAQRLGEAIDLVLDDPIYGKAAAYVGDSFRAAGGAATAADSLEVLA